MHLAPCPWVRPWGSCGSISLMALPGLCFESFPVAQTGWVDGVTHGRFTLSRPVAKNRSAVVGCVEVK